METKEYNLRNLKFLENCNIDEDISTIYTNLNEEEQIKYIKDNDYGIYGIKVNKLIYTVDTWAKDGVPNLLIEAIRNEMLLDEAEFYILFFNNSITFANKVDKSACFAILSNIIKAQNNHVIIVNENRKKEKIIFIKHIEKEKEIKRRRNQRKLNKKYAK